MAKLASLNVDEHGCSDGTRGLLGLRVAPLGFLPFSSWDLDRSSLLLSGPSDVLLEELYGNVFEVLEYLTQLVLGEGLHEGGIPKPTVPASNTLDEGGVEFDQT